MSRAEESVSAMRKMTVVFLSIQHGSSDTALRPTVLEETPKIPVTRVQSGVDPPAPVRQDGDVYRNHFSRQRTQWDIGISPPGLPPVLFAPHFRTQLNRSGDQSDAGDCAQSTIDRGRPAKRCSRICEEGMEGAPTENLLLVWGLKW